MFIPGETISHQFFIPFVSSDIVYITVSYRQNGHVVLEKNVYPGQIENSNPLSTFVVTFSQAESLLFEDEADYWVQVNVFFSGGARCSSMEIKSRTGRQHIREVVG